MQRQKEIDDPQIVRFFPGGYHAVGTIVKSSEQINNIKMGNTVDCFIKDAIVLVLIKNNKDLLQ